jgi:hypothetical protein
MRLYSFKYLRKTILAVGVALFVLSGKSAFAQTEVLFIGNSYTSAHSLVNMIENVASSAGYSLNCVPQVAPGATLAQHAQSAATYAAIQSKTWDYVVLQPQSQETTMPMSMFNTNTFPIAKLLIDSARASSGCSRPILYQTWAREFGDAQNCAVNPPVCTFSGMDSLLNIRFRMMADSLKTVLSPVSVVRKKVVELDSTIHLYALDGSHPNTAGVYATACTFFTIITGADPSTITFNHTLAPQVATTIRQATKLVVYDSLAFWNYYDFPKPKANFTLPDSSCSESNLLDLISNSSTTTHANTVQAQYLWTVDSGGITNTYSDSIPSHILVNNGNNISIHNIALTVSNIYGCDSTFSKSIAVLPNAIARLDTLGPISAKAPLTIDTSIVKAAHTIGNGNYIWFIDSLGTVVYQETGINDLFYTVMSGNVSFTLGLVVESAWNCENDSVSLEFTTNDIGGIEPISRPVIDHPLDLIDNWPPSLLSVDVRSMNGQVIWNSQGNFNALPHLKNGCYYMSLFWDNNAVTRNKFIQID